ncbi:hypothetical protein [Aeromicrobium alkaliterrae]|uniref:Uncharacterized protein n=1 Tax=Aeromicrobium alkaliterrae TaxID=302168 RepID=A0ABN2K4G0_9ACTN
MAVPEVEDAHHDCAEAFARYRRAASDEDRREALRTYDRALHSLHAALVDGSR